MHKLQLFQIVHVGAAHLLEVLPEVVHVCGAKLGPERLNDRVRKECFSLFLTVLIENLKVVKPDVARMSAHDAPCVRRQLLLSRDAVRAYHHEQG